MGARFRTPKTNYREQFEERQEQLRHIKRLLSEQDREYFLLADLVSDVPVLFEWRKKNYALGGYHYATCLTNNNYRLCRRLYKEGLLFFRVNQAMITFCATPSAKQAIAALMNTLIAQSPLLQQYTTLAKQSLKGVKRLLT